MKDISDFDLVDFSIPDVVDEQEEETVTIVEMEEVVAKAKEESFKQGLLEGYEKGHSAANEELIADQTAALKAISASLESIKNDKEKLVIQSEHEMKKLISTIGELLGDQIHGEYYEGYINEFVERVSQASVGSKRLILLLPSSIAEDSSNAIKQKLEAMIDEVDFEIRLDPSLRPCDAKAKWDFGEMQLDLSGFVENLLQITRRAS